MPRQRVLRWVALIVVADLVLGAAFAWVVWVRPLPLPRSPYSFEVPPGASLSTVARRLAHDDVLLTPHLLSGLARLRGEDRAIKAGSYEIEAGTTLPRLLAMLTQGDVTQTSLTIVEGVTFADLKRTLRGSADVRDTVLDLTDAALMEKLGAPGRLPEGMFFPDTYFYAAGSTDLALLARSHRALLDRLAAAWKSRAPNLPLATPYEALILASIVEKETGRAADRPLIASVFINRLRLGMRLQTDPTVIYGMGERFDGNLRRRDLEDGHAVEHLHARRDCRRRRSRCRRRRRWTRWSTRPRPSTCISSRAATATRSFPPISPTTTAPWQNSRRAAADARGGQIQSRG